MTAILQIFWRLGADIFALFVLSFSSRGSIRAENLFLRRQRALYKERGPKPRRVDPSTQVSLALLSRLHDGRFSPVFRIRQPHQQWSCGRNADIFLRKVFWCTLKPYWVGCTTNTRWQSLARG
ncbi:MAG: hypothetical protein ACYDE0_08610 [Acidiferrobacterales bacterium]